MTTIGVTGGIGSGKSSVCRLFANWGARRLDADRIGHEALDDPEVKAALIEAFGEDIEQADGSIDRRTLGKRAFASDESRKRLTDVMWPVIGARLKACVSRSASEGVRHLVIEASVLLERGDPEGLYDTIVVVTAPEAVRIRRTVDRQAITEAEVRDRMRHQMPDQEKIKHADHVIVNDGSREDLEIRAREVWAKLTGNAKE